MINLKQLLSNICYGISGLLGWKEEITPIIENAPNMGAREFNKTFSSVSLATKTYVNLTSVTLTKGTWVITARARYSSNATNIRYLYLGSNSAAASQCSQSIIAVDGSTTAISLTLVINIVSSDAYPIYLVGYQNSGSTLTCSGGLGARKLRDND